MSVLNDKFISYYVKHQGLNITPFYEEFIQPASYDLHLGQTVLRPLADVSDAIPISCLNPNIRYVSHQLPFVLYPQEFVLGVTHEFIGLPNTLMAQVNGKSTLGRLGMSVHQTAGFIDPGFEGHITVELLNVGNNPIILEPGMPIAQIVFFDLVGTAERAYSGRYQYSNTPSPVPPKGIPFEQYIDFSDEEYVDKPNCLNE